MRSMVNINGWRIVTVHSRVGESYYCEVEGTGYLVLISSNKLTPCLDCTDLIRKGGE